MTVIETDRLLLEPWDESRIRDFAQLARDPQVIRYIGPGEVWSRGASDERFRRQLDHWQAHGFGWRSAVEKTTRAWLGFVGLNYVAREAIEVPPGEVEIGWWLAPPAWGRGLATEGALALRDEAFERIGLDRIIGRYQSENVASGRIMEKIGMTFERDAVGRHGEIVRIYGLDSARWRSSVRTRSRAP